MNQKVLKNSSEPKKGQPSAGLKSNPAAGARSGLSPDRQKIVGDFMARLGRFTPPVEIERSDFDKGGT